MRKSEFMRTLKTVVERVQEQKPRKIAVYVALATQYATESGIYFSGVGTPLGPDSNPVIKIIVILAGARVEDIIPLFRDKNPPVNWNLIVLLEESWEYFEEKTQTKP